MTYSQLQETLILTNMNLKKASFLEQEFPYKNSYEDLNLALLDAAKKGEKSISFDFIDSDINEKETLETIERKCRRIYPSHTKTCFAINGTFNYPRYLAARGFSIEIRKPLKKHGYVSRSYFISWEE